MAVIVPKYKFIMAPNGQSVPVDFQLRDPEATDPRNWVAISINPLSARFFKAVDGMNYAEYGFTKIQNVWLNAMNPELVKLVQVKGGLFQKP